MRARERPLASRSRVRPPIVRPPRAAACRPPRPARARPRAAAPRAGCPAAPPPTATCCEYTTLTPTSTTHLARLRDLKQPAATPPPPAVEHQAESPAMPEARGAAAGAQTAEPEGDQGDADGSLRADGSRHSLLREAQARVAAQRRAERRRVRTRRARGTRTPRRCARRCGRRARSCDVRAEVELRAARSSARPRGGALSRFRIRFFKITQSQYLVSVLVGCFLLVETGIPLCNALRKSHYPPPAYPTPKPHAHPPPLSLTAY